MLHNFAKFTNMEFANVWFRHGELCYYFLVVIHSYIILWNSLTAPVKLYFIGNFRKTSQVAVECIIGTVKNILFCGKNAFTSLFKFSSVLPNKTPKSIIFWFIYLHPAKWTTTPIIFGYNLTHDYLSFRTVCVNSNRLVSPSLSRKNTHRICLRGTSDSFSFWPI